jgi:hypothetical protein
MQHNDFTMNKSCHTKQSINCSFTIQMTERGWKPRSTSSTTTRLTKHMHSKPASFEAILSTQLSQVILLQATCLTISLSPQKSHNCCFHFIAIFIPMAHRIESSFSMIGYNHCCHVAACKANDAAASGNCTLPCMAELPYLPPF